MQRPDPSRDRVAAGLQDTLAVSRLIVRVRLSNPVIVRRSQILWASNMAAWIPSHSVAVAGGCCNRWRAIWTMSLRARRPCSCLQRLNLDQHQTRAHGFALQALEARTCWKSQDCLICYAGTAPILVSRVLDRPQLAPQAFMLLTVAINAAKVFIRPLLMIRRQLVIVLVVVPVLLGMDPSALVFVSVAAMAAVLESFSTHCRLGKIQCL